MRNLEHSHDDSQTFGHLEVIDQVLCLANRRTYEQVSSSSPAAVAWLHAGRSFNPRHRSEVGDFQILCKPPFSNGAIS